MSAVIRIRKVGEGTETTLPLRATPGSAGLDLRAAIGGPVVLPPGERRLIPAGIAIDIRDPGVVGVVASRSGLSLKHGLRVAQGIGVIDSDYQGEIGIGIFNRGLNPYTIEPGERICQMMFVPVTQVTLGLVSEFSQETGRGTGGFGSTGNR